MISGGMAPFRSDSPAGFSVHRPAKRWETVLRSDARRS